MSHLMKLAEALRDIAEERDESEIEQALSLCSGFADRVTDEPQDATIHASDCDQMLSCSKLATRISWFDSEASFARTRLCLRPNDSSDAVLYRCA